MEITYPKDIISFETAKLAKEKGFDENVYDFYCPLGELNKVGGDIPKTDGVKLNNHTGYRGDKKKGLHPYTSATTQAQLQRWLREEHDIDTGLYFWNDGSYSYRITELVGIKNLIQHTDDIFIGTYEQTLERALLKALKILK